MLEERLAHEQRLTELQRNFVSMASHEFRTPLTIIDGHAQRMIKTKDRDQEGTYKVDPSGKPATIDVVPGEGPNAGKTLKGIYRVKGDELTICIPVNADSARPKEYEGKEGSGLMLVSLKRDKP